MMSLSDDKQADIIEVCNTSLRYLDAILSIKYIVIYILTIWLVKYTLQSFSLIKPIPSCVCSFLNLPNVR